VSEIPKLNLAGVNHTEMKFPDKDQEIKYLKGNLFYNACVYIESTEVPKHQKHCNEKISISFIPNLILVM